MTWKGVIWDSSCPACSTAEPRQLECWQMQEWADSFHNWTSLNSSEKGSHFPQSSPPRGPAESKKHAEAMVFVCVCVVFSPDLDLGLEVARLTERDWHRCCVGFSISCQGRIWKLLERITLHDMHCKFKDLSLPSALYPENKATVSDGFSTLN